MSLTTTETIVTIVVGILTIITILVKFFGAGKKGKSKRGDGADKARQNQMVGAGAAATQVGDITNSHVTINNHVPGDGMAQAVAAGDNLSTVRCSDIKKELESAMLLQRGQIAKAYEGQKIQWDVKVFSVKERRDSAGGVAVMCSVTEPRFYWPTGTVCMDVKTDKYPALKTAKDDMRMAVVGTILKVSEGAMVCIEPHRIEFVEKFAWEIEEDAIRKEAHEAIAEARAMLKAGPTFETELLFVISHAGKEGLPREFIENHMAKQKKRGDIAMSLDKLVSDQKVARRSRSKSMFFVVTEMGARDAELQKCRIEEDRVAASKKLNEAMEKLEQLDKRGG